MPPSPAARVPILVVDDEPDVHAVTRLALRTMRHEGRPLEILNASSAAECIAALRERPEVAVVLLDVVMESDHAGLEAARAIRGELGNRFTRILLRTGQPGVAPERETIDDYDIDDYLPKADTTTNKLYTSVRTALRAYGLIVELERHREGLQAIHAATLSLRAWEPLEANLERVLDATIGLCPAPLAVLQLDTVDASGASRRLRLHRRLVDDGPTPDQVFYDLGRTPPTEGAVAGGWLVPLRLPRELGSGFLHLSGVEPDPTLQTVLSMLAAQAAGALYAAAARQHLEARQGDLFDEMAI